MMGSLENGWTDLVLVSPHSLTCDVSLEQFMGAGLTVSPAIPNHLMHASGEPTISMLSVVRSLVTSLQTTQDVVWISKLVGIVRTIIPNIECIYLLSY